MLVPSLLTVCGQSADSRGAGSTPRRDTLCAVSGGAFQMLLWQRLEDGVGLLRYRHQTELKL